MYEVKKKVSKSSFCDVNFYYDLKIKKNIFEILSIKKNNISNIHLYSYIGF